MTRLGKALLFSLLVAFATPAVAADPIVMLLLGIAREMAFNAVRDRLLEPRDPDPPPGPTVYPGTTVEPEQVRQLIDEGFGYLSSGQRAEIFESLNAGLLDPKNAAVRATTIEYFADRARTMRMVQERLKSLSGAEKSQIAAEFRKQVSTLPPEETAQLAELLRRQVLPVPSDLNDMLLAELGG